MGVGRTCREVERTGAERCDAHTSSAGQASVCCRHEGRGLFMTGENELNFDLRSDSTTSQILFAGNAENAVDAFILQRSNQKIRTFGHI